MSIIPHSHPSKIGCYSNQKTPSHSPTSILPNGFEFCCPPQIKSILPHPLLAAALINTFSLTPGGASFFLIKTLSSSILLIRQDEFPPLIKGLSFQYIKSCSGSVWPALPGYCYSLYRVFY